MFLETATREHITNYIHHRANRLLACSGQVDECRLESTPGDLSPEMSVGLF